MEGRLLFSPTSGLAADEVPGLHRLSPHPASASLSVPFYLCVLVCMHKYVCRCLCVSNARPLPEYIAVWYDVYPSGCCSSPDNGDLLPCCFPLFSGSLLSSPSPLLFSFAKMVSVYIRCCSKRAHCYRHMCRQHVCRYRPCKLVAAIRRMFVLTGGHRINLSW